MHVLDPLFARRHRRDVTTAALGGLAGVIAILLSILGATGMSPLRLIGFSAVVLLVLGLTAGAVWAVTAAATLLIIEWTFGLLAGSVLPEWTPYLAVGGTPTAKDRRRARHIACGVGGLRAGA